MNIRKNVSQTYSDKAQKGLEVNWQQFVSTLRLRIHKLLNESSFSEEGHNRKQWIDSSKKITFN